jgi:cytochrome c-type biogenesis protein
MADLSILVAFSAGVLSFISPCVLPLIPSYLSFVSGLSLEEMRRKDLEHSARRKLLLSALAFIGGFSLVFISLGASVSVLGQAFGTHRPMIRILGGILVVMVGVYVTGIFRLTFLDRYVQYTVKSRPASYFGSFLVGLTFAVAWTPCVGPILGAILTLAGTSSEINKGILMLAVYSLGLGVPFFLSAVAINLFFGFFQTFRRYLATFHTMGGILLIGVGLLLITDTMAVLNSYALSLTPRWLLERL